jgi:hypothetical protein
MQFGIDVTAFRSKILPPSSELFYPGDGDNRLLRNVCMFLRNCNASYPVRLKLQYSSSWERQISRIKLSTSVCLCKADETWKCHEALVPLGAEVLCFLTEQGGCLLSCTIVYSVWHCTIRTRGHLPDRDNITLTRHTPHRTTDEH